jgi:hypothetical protein
MRLERRGRVKWSHDRSNWKQEDLDACDRQAVRLACLLDGSRMSREVHVRFCERPVVQSRRPTHRGNYDLEANWGPLITLRMSHGRSPVTPRLELSSHQRS